MCYKKIIKVFTIIYEGKQKVGIKVEGLEKNLFLTPTYIKYITGVNLNELEILTDSLIKPIFYEVGEKMFSGKVFNEGSSQIIKTFQIQLEDTIENLRIKKASFLEGIKEIIKVFHFNRNEKDIIGFDIGEDKAVFVPANVVTGITKLDLNEIHILEGSFISPEYYKVGENIYDGLKKEPELCRKNGVILKNLNLRLADELNRLKEKVKYPETKITDFKVDHRFSYSENYNSDNWLEEAAGTNDAEVMNDVYWNLD